MKLPDWLYNWLWKLIHDDNRVIEWNDNDSDDDKEGTLLLLETWADVLREELGEESDIWPQLWDARLSEIKVYAEIRNGNRHLKAAWLTKYGNWDDVPSWAKQWQQDVLGGDHHVYVRIEDKDGNSIHDRMCLAWPPYGEEQGSVTYPEATGWGNFVIAGQNWNPDDGPGPYVAWVDGGDKLWGMGLPLNHHYSFFLVYVED